MKWEVTVLKKKWEKQEGGKKNNLGGENVHQQKHIKTY